ncbi:MAG: hypothetical protein IT381_05435 [Deltaproteobacteria bacterium]|nr:hypothetical protein [Deltaproteobacteria bacterium]
MVLYRQCCRAVLVVHAGLLAERAVARYALDELASLTCSFFVFGQKEWLSDDAQALL